MKQILTALAVVFGATSLATVAAADPVCGAATGEAAAGDPIKVGGIYGNAAPGDFSSGTDAAAAFFACLNANGGINGRPIEYIIENDQWNPELAGQAASKLVDDEGVIAMVASSSFVETSVNAPLYEDRGIMAMTSACPASDCYESTNIVSVLQGPLPSSTGAAMYAIDELGSQSMVCISMAIPSVGDWSCDAVNAYLESRGLTGYKVLVSPASPDINSTLLEALATGADTMLVNLPAGLAIAYLGAAEEQDLRDAYTWISSTPLYDASVPGALGEYWNNVIYVSAEMTMIDGTGPDNVNWLKVMDEFGQSDDPRDTFSQGGFLAAKYFADTLLAMDPADLDDRAAVTQAIKDIVGYTSDLACGPYYVGEAERHMPNRAGIMVVVKDGGFEMVRDCFEYEGPYFDQIIANEKALGME